MAVVTDFANVAAAQSAGYTLETWATTDAVPGRVNRGLAQVTTNHAKLEKLIVDEGGEAEMLEAFGESTTDAASAQANCLSSLNAIRRERYAGAPGDPSGSTVVSQYPDGTVPTVDTN